MNDFDLESKVKAVRVPERNDEYWEAFPQRVLAELRAVPMERPERWSYLTGLWCGGQVAMACLALAFCLWQSRMPRGLSHTLRNDERQLRQSMARFQNNLGRLMQDEHGLQKLVEDPP